ncbi:MAG: DGQHR domain-containing protein [Bryobacteraceae bacterium]
MKRVRALAFKQKTTKLYCFTMSAMELEPLCYVEPATRDNAKGLQRVTEPSRLREISGYLNSGERAILPNNIILNLKPEVMVEENGDGTVTLVFPEDKGDFGFVVDGQHRLFSFNDEYREMPADGSFELPVVALHNATEEMVGQTFVEINVNQKPVNKDLLTQMKAILGLLDTDYENSAIDLIHGLDEDKQSPLYDRVLRFPKERNKWIKVTQVFPIVVGFLLPGGCLHSKTNAERKQILIAYLEAVQSSFPDAWADSDTAAYSLLQTAGLQIMLSILPDAMQRCDFLEQFNYTAASFERQLKPLVESSLLGSWRKAAVEDPLSTQAKRKLLLGQLKEIMKVKPPILTSVVLP